jgi:deoxyribonuclease V
MEGGRMIFAVDVYYQTDAVTNQVSAIAAGIVFKQWNDRETQQEVQVVIDHIEEYEPGQFYKRELPCILKLLESLDSFPEIIVIDGYCYLDSNGRAGLGQYLYDAIDGQAIVIGIAKTRFQDIPADTELLRGISSQRPLYVTAIGIDLPTAKSWVAAMDGDYRIPNLLKQVDRLSRTQP